MEKVKKSLVKKEYLVPFVLVTSLFFLWGFAHAILDVLNKHFQEALVMTKAHSALIQATMYTVNMATKRTTSSQTTCDRPIAEF